MSVESGLVTCSNPECRVRETGRCIEGFALNECDRYGKSIDASEGIGSPAGVADEGASVSSAPDGVVLPSADYLNVSQASAELRRRPCRLLAIIGPSDAGKTSLIASSYELFLEAHQSGIGFANSLTLHAFEQACHDAREASRRCVPHSERTKQGRVQFYHMAFATGSPSRHLSVLYGDRAGEEYRSATDNIAILSSFPEMGRADSVTLLVDGERLTNSRTRHSLRNEVIMIVQSIVDSGVLPSVVPVAIVLTKYDVIRNNDDANTEAFFGAVIEKVRELFGSSFSDIAAFKVAASPKSDAVPRGYGVRDLMEFWINARGTSFARNPEAELAEKSDRAFWHLKG